MNLQEAALERWNGWEYGDTLRDMGTMDTILDMARRLLEGDTDVWLCVERQNGMVLRVTNMPGSELHCYFRAGINHLPDCGYKTVVEPIDP